MPFVAAVLLAAGESTRMGQQKALVPWEGTTLLEYQLTQLSSIDDIQQIIVVTGHEPEAITGVARAFERATIAHNPDYRTGKVSSIIAGLRAVDPRAEAIVLLAVDQPRPAEIMRAVLRQHFERGAKITVPAREGHRGHPVVFGSALLPELLTINEETKGVRAVMEGHRGDTLEVEIADAAIFVDLNAPADVAEARAAHESHA